MKELLWNWKVFLNPDGGQWHGFDFVFIMSIEKKSNNGRLPQADTGNASNPSPRNKNFDPPKDQLLNGKAEKYLRESANIEDEPDAQDQQDADQAFNSEK